MGDQGLKGNRIQIRSMLKNPYWEQDIWNLQRKPDTEEVGSEVEVIEDAPQVQLLMQRKKKRIHDSVESWRPQ